MVKIEVLGSGCPKCEAAERNARRAVEDLGLDVQVEHIYDVKEFAKRGVMMTPAVAVDGEVKIAGHVPSVGEVKKLLAGTDTA